MQIFAMTNCMKIMMNGGIFKMNFQGIPAEIGKSGQNHYLRPPVTKKT